MAWIRTIPDEEWTGDLEPLRAELTDPAYGRVDNILAIHALNPQAMAAHNALYLSAMRGTPTLRKVERELIAYVVSAANDCHY